MESSLKLTLCLLITILPFCSSNSDYKTLIYKNCANKTLTAMAHPNPNAFSQTLSSLFQQLIQQSSNSNFFKQTMGLGYTNEPFLSGLFQCRGDMTKKDCNDCIIHSQQLSNTLCADSISARIHLQGCYMIYEPDGVEEKSKYELIHKVCEESNAVSFSGSMKDAAFGGLEEGIGRSGNGFYEGRNERVKVMGQCQGDLWGCDCAECVGSAVQIAQEECGGSAAGQVYLDNCYISYQGKGDKDSNSGGKLVAIVLGGAATLGLGFILLVFFKSCGKKDDDLV